MNAHPADAPAPHLPHDAALVLIDVQRGFDEPGYWGPRNNPGAEANVARLLEAWRESGRPVFHVRHASREPRSPLHPDNPGHAFKPEALPLPGEPVITKSVNSAFIGTPLEAELRACGIGTLVVAGLVTESCVSTTARMAGNLGFGTFVVSDATAALAHQGPDGTAWDPDTVHAVSLATLSGEFATIATTDALVEAARVSIPVAVE
jgi:nicotinamidase-related amidase